MSKGVNLTINLLGRDVSASKAIKGVGQASEKTHSTLGKFGKAGKLAGVAVAGGIGLAIGAAAAAIPVIKGMAQQAAEDEKGQKRLALGLRKTAGATKDQISAVEDWITKVGEAKGVADDQLRPALQRLAQATGDVNKAQSLTTLAMDISAGSGKSLETVAGALAKAHDGNAGALARLGIKTKDASGKTLDFDRIVKNAAKTYGGQAAEAAGTLEGKVGRLSLIFSETKESIGGAFLPAISDAAGFLLSKGVPAVRSLAEKALPKLRGIFDGIKDTVKANLPGLKIIGGAFLAIGRSALTTLGPALLKLQSYGFRGLIIVVGKLGQLLPSIASGFLRFAAKAVGGFRGLYSAATAVLEGILKVASKTMGWIPGIGPKIKAAEAGFSHFRDKTVAELGKVQDSLNRSADRVDAFNRKAKLKANIDDLKAKIKDAKERLSDPKLSAEKKAKLKAEIADLKAKVAEAKEKLNSIPASKTVKVHLQMTANGRAYYRSGPGQPWQPLTKITAAGGGLIRGAGTGTSDSIPAMLSNGEYVVREASVRALGVGFMDAVNAVGSATRRAAIAALPAPRAVSAGGGANPQVVVPIYLEGRVIQQALIEYETNTGRFLVTNRKAG